MALLGLIPEPPFHPLSWSGSSAFFFRALRSKGLLEDAAEVRLSRSADMLQKARVFSLPLERWKENYHASVSRFTALTEMARPIASRHPQATGLLQIGAWFCSPSVTTRPCFSYHDGNAALWYRYYGRELLGPRKKTAHLSWEQTVYERLTGIFVMSSWLASSFVSDFGVPSSKVHVVGAGANLEHLPDVPPRDFTKARFLFVGRDFVRKGGRYLLEAFRRVRRTAAHAELVIAGPDLSLDEPGVTCAGFLSKFEPAHVARLHELFVNATAVVLPSIYEPFGVALTEGMVYGLPCIAADRCAMPEIVRHGESGFVVPAEEIAPLADAMLALATDPARAAAMGRAGRLRAEQHFTWTAVAGKLQHVLADQYHVR